MPVDNFPPDLWRMCQSTSVFMFFGSPLPNGPFQNFNVLMLTYAHSNDVEQYRSIDYLECPRAFTSKLYVVSSVSCCKYTMQI